MPNSVKLLNYKKPEPKWFRISKKIFYGVFATALFSDVLVEWFGMSGRDVSMISGLVISVIETTGSILSNGENYTNTNND